MRTDPISDDEILYLQEMQAVAELADFDRYVNTLVDPRKPGNLKWLMEIYPDYVIRRIQQVHTDYEFALRCQMIDTYGINTFEDLIFMYMRDQKKIKGPKLSLPKVAGKGYFTGVLAPAAFRSERLDGVRLPFASANFGARAPDDDSWIMKDDAMPLAGDRKLKEMAAHMYNDNPRTAFPVATA
jgi:hypothetical protein